MRCRCSAACCTGIRGALTSATLRPSRPCSSSVWHCRRACFDGSEPVPMVTSPYTEKSVVLSPLGVVLASALLVAAPVGAADLNPKTAAAFDKYVQIAERRIAREVAQRDTFRMFLRFYMKKVIAVTVDSEHEAKFTTAGPDRVYSAIHSTRIAEVVDAGAPAERAEQPGHGHGFMWRLNTYWRFLERDGGT